MVTKHRKYKPSKQYTQIAEQTKTCKLKVSSLNIYVGMFFSSKAEHANKSSPPIIFMGGPSGPPHKNGGEESLAEYPS